MEWTGTSAMAASKGTVIDGAAGAAVALAAGAAGVDGETLAVGLSAGAGASRLEGGALTAGAHAPRATRVEVRAGLSALENRSTRRRMRTWALVSMLLASALAGTAPITGCGEETQAETDPEPEPEPEPEPQPEPAAPRLGLNDVSVLVPLPASKDAPGHLVATSQGAKGVLLPQDVYDAIPTFPVTPSQGLDYDRMRTVAIRFDGCFPKPTGCEAQIRLVMQPVANDASMKDSALHLFYRLEEAELVELVSELRRLRSLAPEVADAPLDVHAALVAQGLDGAYGAALKEVVLRFAGEQNLSRMTFFLRAPPVNEVWFFGGFEREGGELTMLDIAGLGQSNQQVIRTEVEGGWEYTVNPISSVPSDERVLLSNTRMDQATAEQRAGSFAKHLRVQSPLHFSPDDLSCAGCHVGTFVLEQARANYGLDPAAFPADVFTSTHDLTLQGKARATVSSLRAFGWFKAEPMIAERVVNESAAVVDDLESRFPAE